MIGLPSFPSGRCGISADKLHTVKCLHYHLSDLLIRHPPPLSCRTSSKGSCASEAGRFEKAVVNEEFSEEDKEDIERMQENPINIVGQLVYQDLIKEGFEVDGTVDCWKECRSAQSTPTEPED